MKENVFQCHGEHTDKQQFLKTVGGMLEEHINKIFTYPQDVASICKTFAIIALVQPPNLTDEEYKTDMGKKKMWEETMKTFIKRINSQESNARAIYAIVWGQCSPMMQFKLESLDDYEARSDACDCAWILKEIQGITHRFEGTHNVFISLDDAWSNYYAYRQGNRQTLHEFLKDYQGLVQVLKHYGVALGAEGPYQDVLKAKIKKDKPRFTDAEYRGLTTLAAKQKAVAIGFLKRADCRQYGGLWSDLEKFLREAKTNTLKTSRVPTICY
jgi:hypothetical protein